MIANINGFQKLKFAYILTRKFYKPQPRRKIRLRVYFHPVVHCFLYQVNYWCCCDRQSLLRQQNNWYKTSHTVSKKPL